MSAFSERVDIKGKSIRGNTALLALISSVIHEASPVTGLRRAPLTGQGRLLLTHNDTDSGRSSLSQSWQQPLRVMDSFAVSF